LIKSNERKKTIMKLPNPEKFWKEELKAKKQAPNM